MMPNSTIELVQQGDQWEISLKNLRDFDTRVGRDVLNAFCRCFVHVDRLNSMVSCMHASRCHHGLDSVAYTRDLDTLAWFTVGTLRELALAITKLRSALAKRSLLDPESDPWLTLRRLEKRWENDESYRKMRNVAAFHVDEELIDGGLDGLTIDPCVPLANGHGSKHVKSRLTLGFLALHNGLGLDLDRYRGFHEVVMADLDVVPGAIQNAFIDVAKAIGVPFGTDRGHERVTQ